MFNQCTEFTVSGIWLLQVLCPVLSCFITFIFNIFVTTESMYSVMMIEKKPIAKIYCKLLFFCGYQQFFDDLITYLEQLDFY